MREKAVNGVSTKEEVKKKIQVEMDFEDALDLAGVGRYQVWHCALMLLSLTAAVLEMTGSAFILPAAACDLDIPESLRGIITSIPNIAIILTAPLWGCAADALGRKPVLLGSSAAAGALGLVATAMPGLTSFAICKFVGALFLACPSSLGFVYAGEMVPRRRRDLAVLVVSGLVMITSVSSPALAWAILPFDWRYQLSTLTLRPWRLLTAAYAAPLLFSALWMIQAKESPKFLMTQSKHKQALDVLRHIFAVNSGLPANEFCVTSIKASTEEENNFSLIEDSEAELTSKLKSQSALALVRPPHLKWLLLTGFLMFGLFSLLNGLFMFSTDTINKVMRESSDVEGTVCILMTQAQNQSSAVCNDNVSNDTFLLIVGTTVVYSLLVLGASFCPVSKKSMLVVMFGVNGFACLLSGLLTNRTVASFAMSALQLTAMGIGPLTAYAVELFPTSLRGTAVGVVMMCGRAGSVAGANFAGYFLAVACPATFHTFTALLFLCAVLSLLLPQTKPEPEPEAVPPVMLHIDHVTDSR